MAPPLHTSPPRPAVAAPPLLLLLLLLPALASSVAPALPLSAAPGPGTWKLNVLDSARYPLAQCLDGSYGAFYVSAGTGALASTVVFHMQGACATKASSSDAPPAYALKSLARAHPTRKPTRMPTCPRPPTTPSPHAAGGGWCTSIEDCYARATKPVYAGEPSIGSSAAWGAGPCTPDTLATTPPCTADGGSGGLLSLDPTVNPLSGSTRVWLGYCDGGGFAGDVDAPVPYNSSVNLYFRGKRILEAIVDTLQNDFGLAAAEAVVVSGCSAGGNAAFFMADHIASLVHARNASTRVVAAPGAGFFLDTTSYGGANNVEAMYKFVFDSMNVITSVKASCVAAIAPRDPSLCMIPPVFLPFIGVPLFVSNSLTDAAQLSWIMALPCTPSSGGCNASELAYVDNYRSLMIDALQPVLNSGGRHGAWLVSCEVHMVQDVDGAWTNITVAGVPSGRPLLQRDAFSAWFFGTGAADVVGIDAPWTQGGGVHGGNAACGNYGPVPSSPGGG